MRIGDARSAIKSIGSRTGNKGVVVDAAGQILNIDQCIASGITATGASAIGVIQVHCDSGIGRRVTDAIMRTGDAGAAIKIIGCKAGNEGIVVATSG